MLLNAPLIRLRHLLPPQKTAEGEGLSIERVARGFGVKCTGALDEKEWLEVSMEVRQNQ
jgi:hypothetical protein